MKQLFLTYFVILILPFLLGVIAQLLLGRKLRWLLPSVFAALAVAAAAYAMTNPVPGSEGPGLRAVQLVCLAAGAALTALIKRKK